MANSSVHLNGDEINFGRWLGFVGRHRCIMLTMVCLLGTLSSCTNGDQDDTATFKERFNRYVAEQVLVAEDCDDPDCIENMSIPVFTKDSLGRNANWNHAAMIINPDQQQDQLTVEGTTYISRDKKRMRIYVPVKFSSAQKQRQFLCDHIGESFQYAAYTIAPELDASTDNWLLDIQVNRSLSTRNLLFLLLGLLVLFVLTLKCSDATIRTFGIMAGSAIVVLLLIAIRLLFSLPMISQSVAKHEIFRNQLRSSVLSPSLGELFLNMLLFFFITIFLFKSFESRKFRKYDSIKRWGLLISGYLLVMASILSFVYVVKRVVVFSTIAFQFDKIYVLDWNTHIFILSILLFISSLFFLSYLLIKILAKTGAKLDQRIMAFFIATLITFPIFLKFSLHVSAFGFYILVLSILILMDLFVETQRKSISWLVLWLVTIASGTTALLYAHNSIAYYQKGQDLAEQLAISYQTDDQFSISSVANSENYDWAIFDGYVPVMQSGSPPLHDMQDKSIPSIKQIKKISNKIYRAFVYRHSPGIFVMVSKKQDRVIQFISLFSFLFTSLALVISLIFLLNVFFKFIPDGWRLRLAKGQSIRRRIQYVILGVLILSFATVFAVTSFYLRDFRTDEPSVLTEKQRLGLQFLRDRLVNSADSTTSLSSVNSYTENNVQYNIYGTSGKLLSESQNSIFKLAPKSLTNNSSTSSTEGIALVNYQNWSGAFQRMPFNKSNVVVSVTENQADSSDDYFINNLLGTLLNVYIFLFVVASSIALTFSDTITRPLLKLREKFSSVKIGRSNEPIDWHSNDELGQLINDYNRMIAKIEDSVNTLTMTERELAWREMAKQVAHEIKNPLTPMKLSLQHMQMAAKRDPERAQELIDGIGKTLLEQIDNLAHIASEFSNFAKMPTPENKRVVLNEVASSVHDLFRKREDMDINLYIPIDEIYVFGDHHYMSRVLINLLKNAIQAIPNERRGSIEIHVYKDEENAIIKVKDNGTGIPEAIQDKVFQPNFTSKNSGTGLGLAICANIVESFNGKIYFETTQNIGTTFFIEIPLMHMADNFKKENHVIL